MSYESDDLPVWPLLPNWKRGVTDAVAFKTNIIGPTLTGMRQKRKNRIAPRRSIGFEVHPHHDSRRLFDNMRFSMGRRMWLLPMWMDVQKLPLEALMGSDEITCETEGYDFHVGGRVLLREDRLLTTNFEVAEIAEVNVDGLVLVDELANPWAAGTRVYPLRNARVSEDSQNVTLLNGEVSTMSVMMEVAEPCDWPAYEFAHTYRGRPVFVPRANWKDQRSFGVERLTTSVDNTTSLPVYFDFPNKPFASINCSLMAKTRAQTAELRSLLYALAGRYTSLWTPTLTNDLVVIADIDSAATTIDVGYAGYTVFGLGLNGRRDIMVELLDGSVYYRRITDSVEVSGGERITINSALGVDVSRSSIRRVCFLMLMQQASDATTMLYHTDRVTTLPLAFEGVIEPPE